MNSNKRCVMTMTGNGNWMNIACVDGNINTMSSADYETMLEWKFCPHCGNKLSKKSQKAIRKATTVVWP